MRRPPRLTWVSGPPLALGLAGVLWSTGVALAGGGLVLLVATIGLRRPTGLARLAADGSRFAVARRFARAPALRTLVLVLIAVGVLFGAVEVAVTAAAQQLAMATAAAPLLALWGAGSLAGGLLAARLRANALGAHNAAGLLILLGALTAGHLSLIPAAGSVFALGPVLLVAGAAIAPTYATVYAIVDRTAPTRNGDGGVRLAGNRRRHWQRDRRSGRGCAWPTASAPSGHSPSPAAPERSQC